MSWLSVNVISTFLLPPLNAIVISLAGLALLRRKPGLGASLIAAAIAILCILSLPVVGESLLRSLENRNETLLGPVPQAQAIVVLAAGRRYDAPEFGGDTVSNLELERMRYAALLQKRTGLPLAISGGNPEARPVAESVLMAQMMKDEFGVQPRWQETVSENTDENASQTYGMLASQGVRRILLVTHAWHMPRAILAFRRAGFDVVPAPTGFTGRSPNPVLRWIPNASALLKSSFGMHEWIGLMWYRLKWAITDFERNDARNR